MPLHSDITIAVSKFDPASISEKSQKLNEYLKKLGDGSPSWFEVGAPKYRQMRLAGKTALPKPVVLPEGIDIKLPTRASSVDCRVFYPSSPDPSSKPNSNGIIMHIHGGGWVLMDQTTSDPLLKLYADCSKCTVISVGYRLAPEHPFPAGPEDCYDVAEYLVKNGEKEFGGPLRFIGGESAGAHLSLLTAYHILRTHPTHRLSGLLLHYGAYDLSFLPTARIRRNLPVLSHAAITNFVQAFCPGMDSEALRDPAVSPYYEDLAKWRGKLPAALFTCGSEDCLLDDTMAMATRYLMAGGEAVVKIYEGEPHGFTTMPDELSDGSKKARLEMMEFIEDRLGAEEVS